MISKPTLSCDSFWWFSLEALCFLYRLFLCLMHHRGPELLVVLWKKHCFLNELLNFRFFCLIINHYVLFIQPYFCISMEIFWRVEKTDRQKIAQYVYLSLVILSFYTRSSGWIVQKKIEYEIRSKNPSCLVFMVNILYDWFVGKCLKISD